MRVCCACVKCEWEDSLTRRRSERLEIHRRTERTLGFAFGFPKLPGAEGRRLWCPGFPGPEEGSRCQEGVRTRFRTHCANFGEFLVTWSLGERRTDRTAQQKGVGPRSEPTPEFLNREETRRFGS